MSLMRLSISLITLFALVTLSTYFDIRTKKIPNLIPIIGVIIGLGLSVSLSDFAIKVLILAFLFFFGMLGLMGLGDIKLWMAISCLIPFADSCFIVAGGALLLIAYSLIRDYKRASGVVSITFKSLLYNRKLIVMEQESYAFAPFICIATMLYLLLQTGGLLLW